MKVDFSSQHSLGLWLNSRELEVLTLPVASCWPLPAPFLPSPAPLCGGICFFYLFLSGFCRNHFSPWRHWHPPLRISIIHPYAQESLCSCSISLVPVLIIPTSSFPVLLFIIYLFYFLVVVIAQDKHSKHCLMNQSFKIHVQISLFTLNKRLHNCIIRKG